MPTRKRYRVLRGLSYPTDPKVIRRLLAGERVPWEERRMKVVDVGVVVNDIPAVSVPGLLARGAIEAVDGETEVSDDT